MPVGVKFSEEMTALDCKPSDPLISQDTPIATISKVTARPDLETVKWVTPWYGEPCDVDPFNTPFFGTGLSARAVAAMTNSTSISESAPTKCRDPSTHSQSPLVRTTHESTL